MSDVILVTLDEPDPVTIQVDIIDVVGPPGPQGDPGIHVGISPPTDPDIDFWDDTDDVDPYTVSSVEVSHPGGPNVAAVLGTLDGRVDALETGGGFTTSSVSVAVYGIVYSGLPNGYTPLGPNTGGRSTSYPVESAVAGDSIAPSDEYFSFGMDSSWKFAPGLYAVNVLYVSTYPQAVPESDIKSGIPFFQVDAYTLDWSDSLSYTMNVMMFERIGVAINASGAMFFAVPEGWEAHGYFGLSGFYGGSVDPLPISYQISAVRIA